MCRARTKLAAEEQAEDAQALAAEGDTDAALAKLQQAVAIDPANDALRGDYVRAAARARPRRRRAARLRAGGRQGDHRRARWPRSATGSRPARRRRARAAPKRSAAAIAANKRDFDARFELAQTHFAAQRFTQAMDELLEIVMRDKAWNGELARKTYVAILELMSKPAPKAPAAGAESAKGTLEVTGKAAVASADPVVDQYRRKLSMALF